MKRYRNIGKIVFSLLLTTIILVVTLATPSILLKLEDSNLYSVSHTRKQMGGSLTDGSYLAWALHARNKSIGFFNTMEPIESTEEDAVLILFAMSSKLEELVQFGIIPMEFIDGMYVIIEAFDRSGKAVGQRFVDEFGFERLSWYYYHNNDYLDITMQIETKTGKVVEFFISSNFLEKYISKETLLNSIDIEKYVEWLGIGQKKDWEDASSNEEFAITDDAVTEYHVLENKDLQVYVYGVYEPNICYGLQVSAV